MRRRTFDSILATGGLISVIALLVAGGLLMWGANFATGNVHDQLSQQQIFFPAAGSPALASPEISPYLNQYAGQQLTTGDQAEAYADHFIAVHVSEIAGGKTYAQVSSAAQADAAALKADPTNTDLKTKLAGEQAQVTSLFQGQTLRGLLLEAYGFAQMGTIAFWAGIAAFISAGVMLVLVILGFVHYRRVDETAEI